MDGSQRGPFLGPPSAFSLRRTRSSERVQGSHAVVEGCRANTPQSILVHWVLRGPPQGLPDDLQPLALPSGFPNPTGLHVRADGDLRTAGLQMLGSDPPPLPAPSSLLRGRRPGQRSCWDVKPEGPIHPDAGQCLFPTRLHVPRVRTSVLGGPAAPAPHVNTDKPVLALLSPGMHPLCPLPGHTPLRSAPAPAHCPTGQGVRCEGRVPQAPGRILPKPSILIATRLWNTRHLILLLPAQRAPFSQEPLFPTP